MIAQNTIGGVKTTVPEAEVKRQGQFIEAERERLLEHYDKATELYKAFLYENESNATAWYGLARTYMAQKQYPEAQEAIAKAVAADPTTSWYAVLQAEIFEKNSRPKDAAMVYEGLTKRFPQTPEFYQRLAYLSLLAEDPKGGLKALDRLEQLTGLTEEVADKKHVIYVAMGDDKKAAAELERLANAFPGKLEYRQRLAKYYEAMRDPANARRVYEDILKRDPNDAVAKLAVVTKDKTSSDAAYLTSLQPLFADSRVSIDQKIKEIAPYLSKMEAATDPALTQSMLVLGNLIEKAHPEDAKAWSLSGDLLYLANRPEDALEKYRQCIRLNAPVFSVWNNLLTILNEQKNYEEMLRMAEQAMDAFPNQPKAYYFYAVAATEKGLYDDALRQLDQANLMSAKNPQMQLDILDQTGVVLLRKKDFPGSLAKYEAALAKGGDKNADVLEHYGDALAQSGNNAKALEVWKKANALRPSAGLARKIAGE